MQIVFEKKKTIANKLIDCRKIDSLNRDSYHLGFKIQFDWKRLLIDSNITPEDYKSIIQNGKNIEIFEFRDHIEKHIKSHLQIPFNNMVSNGKRVILILILLN